MTADQRTPTTRRRRRSFLPKTIAGRRRLVTAVILGSATAAGYLVTCVAYPRPFLRRDNSIARVIGLPADQAERELTGLGFKVKIEGQEPDPAIPAGRVLWQDPPPETILPPGGTVQLTVSDGPAPVIVPDVVGLSLPYAERILGAAGIKVGDVDTVRAAPEPGVVMAVRPPPGNGQPRGSSVDLLVSGGEGGGS